MEPRVMVAALQVRLIAKNDSSDAARMVIAGDSQTACSSSYQAAWVFRGYICVAGPCASKPRVQSAVDVVMLTAEDDSPGPCLVDVRPALLAGGDHPPRAELPAAKRNHR